MISPDSLRVLALTVAIGSLMGAFLWWDATTVPEAVNAEPAVQRSVPQLPRPATEPRSLDRFSAQSAPPASPNRLYRCTQGGKTTYQVEPCSRGSMQSEVAGGSVSVVNGRVGKDQLARVHAMRQTPTGRQETAFGEITAAPPEALDYRCPYLIEAIERVDEQGRRPNKSHTLERLRRERRALVEEAYELNCPRIPQ